MWIKICGNTRLEDCLLAADLGADAVGFVFAAGKRTVTAPQVASITARLPDSLEKIGVFTSRDAAAVVDAATEAGLTGIQLHGAPDVAFTRELLSRVRLLGKPLRILQVLHWEVDQPAALQASALMLAAQAAQEHGGAQALLVDSKTQTGSGGTGVPFDWAAAAALFRESRLPVIAAGGLRPANVADAVRTLRPWGVDVSSGVEASPGVKDATLLREFVARARSAAEAGC